MSNTAVKIPSSTRETSEDTFRVVETLENPLDNARLNSLYEDMDAQDKRACRLAKQRALQLKKEQGIKQETMAKRAGWSQGNLAVYLNGKPIGRNVMPRLCLALDCQPHDIRPELKDPKDERQHRQVKRQVRQTMEFLKDIQKREDLSEALGSLLETQISNMQKSLG